MAENKGYQMNTHLKAKAWLYQKLRFGNYKPQKPLSKAIAERAAKP